MKEELNPTTPQEKRIVISIIGWVIDLIILAIRRRKKKD